MKFALLSGLLLLLSGCTGIPESVRPVSNFELNRYLGTWYEIARLDHSFERGLEKVTATYQQKEDGGIKVLNQGYSPKKDTWDQAKGRAYFVRSSDIGYLKVSFFGPFFGSYVIFGLDQQNYQYAFVSGPDYSYLWLLSRTPEVSPALKQKFIETSRQLGFDTDQLIWVKQ